MLADAGSIAVVVVRSSEEAILIWDTLSYMLKTLQISMVGHVVVWKQNKETDEMRCG